MVPKVSDYGASLFGQVAGCIWGWGGDHERGGIGPLLQHVKIFYLHSFGRSIHLKIVEFSLNYVEKRTNYYC